jgi:hypothetical protein
MLKQMPTVPTPEFNSACTRLTASDTTGEIPRTGQAKGRKGSAGVARPAQQIRSAAAACLLSVDLTVATHGMMGISLMLAPASWKNAHVFIYNAYARGQVIGDSLKISEIIIVIHGLNSQSLVEATSVETTTVGLIILFLQSYSYVHTLIATSDVSVYVYRFFFDS